VNTLARIISVCFHPLLMTTYLIALLSLTLPLALHPVNAESFQSFMLLIFLMTFALPALNIALFRMFGTIRSFSMEERSERIIPFFLITFIYAFVTWLFVTKTRVSFDDSLFKILAIIDCLVMCAALITLFFKISIHSMGILGVLGIVLPLNKVAENNALFIPTIILVVLAGLVMSARLQLNAHSPREVMLGGITGFAIGFFGMIVLF
jgi:membrane-associated phospholipid phosphatase